MEPGRFERLMSRCKTADSQKTEISPNFRGGKNFRFRESVFVLDRNPIWMTPRRFA